MMNTITLDLGYMPVEIRVVRGVRTRDSQRFASSGFVGWRYSDTSWKDCVEDQADKLKKKPSMQKNNYLSEVNLSLFKTTTDIFKVESANVHFHSNPYISPITQR